MFPKRKINIGHIESIKIIKTHAIMWLNKKILGKQHFFVSLELN